MVDREAGGCGQQRVAVRRGAGDGLGRQVAAGATAVLDHEALLQAVGELGRDQPADDVGKAARRERHDHGDVLRWIGLRAGRASETNDSDSAGDQRAIQASQRNMAVSFCYLQRIDASRAVARGTL